MYFKKSVCMKLYLRAYSSWSTQILQKCISCFFPSVVNLYWSRSRSGISIIFSRIIMLSPAGTPLGASGPRSGFLTGSTGRRWGRSLLFLSRWKNVRCSRGRWKILFTCNEKNRQITTRHILLEEDGACAGVCCSS